MKKTMRHLRNVSIALLLGAASAEADTRPFEQRYPALARRNIFDPERSRSSSAPLMERPRLVAPPSAADVRETVRLLGVALTEREAFAHFSGAGAPPVARVGDRIGEWELAEIRERGAVVRAGDRTLEWPVGRALIRDSSGTWSLAADAASAPIVQAAPTAPPDDGTRPSAVSGGMSEIMQRLMERRRREMGP